MATWDIAADINTIVRGSSGDAPLILNSGAEGYLRFDLAVDPLGRFGKVTGKLKLAQQLTFAFVNRRTVGIFQNFQIREYEALVLAAVKAFQAAQQRFILENEPDLLGWDLLKANRVTGEFVRLNNLPIARSVADTEVKPGRREQYQIARRSKRSPAAGVSVELIAVTPPVAGGSFQVFQSVVVYPEPDNIRFWFKQNRTFRPDEILRRVLDINVREGADPRAAVVSLRVQTLAGERVTVSLPLPVFDGMTSR